MILSLRCGTQKRQNPCRVKYWPTTLAILAMVLASALLALDSIINAQGTPPPMTTHPALTANEIALFRPDGSVWLTIHRRGENDWRPSSVDILTDYKPIVKKVRST